MWGVGDVGLGEGLMYGEHVVEVLTQPTGGEIFLQIVAD
ncbi:hypothetical protein Lepto7375DRAFT_4410 [Leptolyngbya sp. PCC 7375]|nr:hypothetical protein Lepto7375DRAFT_4410 [Leptolyngbya sp. PCC 7375]